MQQEKLFVLLLSLQNDESVPYSVWDRDYRVILLSALTVTEPFLHLDVAGAVAAASASQGKMEDILALQKELAAVQEQDTLHRLSER